MSIPNAHVKLKRGTDPLIRFWSKVERTDTCWIWRAKKNHAGYGEFSIGHARHVLAHRWIHERLIGTIPIGYQIDHLCRNPACVRPEHLEAVTPRVNTLRSTNPSALKAQQTHCHRGHPFDGQNTYVRKNGTRWCLACAYERTRMYRAKRKAA